MTAPIIAFFNNKGGVGKTSLVYHVAWMFADRGVRVVAADLDPQANLTAAFLDERRVMELWDQGRTVFGGLRPLLEGTGTSRYRTPSRSTMACIWCPVIWRCRVSRTN